MTSIYQKSSAGPQPERHGRLAHILQAGAARPSRVAAAVALWAAAAAGAPVSAQTLQSFAVEERPSILPAEFSYDGKPRLVTTSSNVNNGSLVYSLWLYDDNFQVSKSFSFPSRNMTYTHTTRMREPVYRIVDDGEGHTEEVFEGYVGEWTEKKEDYDYEAGSAIGFVLDNSGVDYTSRSDMVVTQTLFNSDGLYEHIVPIYEKVTTSTREEDRDGNGEVDYTETNESICRIGYDIVSEDGTVLYSIRLDDRHQTTSSPRVMKIGDKLLFCTDEYPVDRSGEYKYLCFVLNPGGSLTAVKAPEHMAGISVSPRVAGAGESIRVDIGEPDGVMREVIVNNAAGQAVFRTAIPAGRSSVEIDATRLCKGVNVLTVRGGSRRAGGVKVIVR